MAFDDHVEELVRRSLWFDRLHDMGMIGVSGKLANAEACRRNAWIRNKQKELGITSNQLRILKEDFMAKGGELS